MNLRFGRFSNPEMSLWWGLEEVKEVHYTLMLVSTLLEVVLMAFFGYSIWKATVVAFIFHFIVGAILALASTIAQLNYRVKQNTKENMYATINKLALNKTRKSNASKTGFEN